MSEHLMIDLDPTRRLVVSRFENNAGQRFVTVASQYCSRGGEWKLAHSGLVLPPAVARALGPALHTMAAGIEDNPPEPHPTQADREDSRWP